MFQREEYVGHCHSGEALWFQEEAALQMHCFRDAEPQPVIPQDPKKIMEFLSSSSDQGYISACPPLTPDRLELNRNESTIIPLFCRSLAV